MDDLSVLVFSVASSSAVLFLLSFDLVADLRWLSCSMESPGRSMFQSGRPSILEYGIREVTRSLVPDGCQIGFEAPSSRLVTGWASPNWLRGRSQTCDFFSAFSEPSTSDSSVRVKASQVPSGLNAGSDAVRLPKVSCVGDALGSLRSMRQRWVRYSYLPVVFFFALRFSCMRFTV